MEPGAAKVEQVDEAANGRRKVGLPVATALVIGNMIGSGIFLLPAALAPYGGITLFSWLLVSIGALCMALTFARLSRTIPRTGGPYAYTHEGFGDFAGFWIAWGYWNSLWISMAGITVALVSYLRIFLPFLNQSGWLAALAAVLAIVLMMFFNLQGIKQAGAVQFITMILKLIPLVAVATIGFFWFQPAHLLPFNASGQPPFVAISGVAALIAFSFQGMESATVPAGDIKDPGKTIARATVFGVIFVALLYILSSTVVLGVLPRNILLGSQAPFADAAASMWGKWAYYAVGLGACISCLGSLNGIIIVASRVPMAAAQDNLFPRSFGRLSRKAVPAFSIITSCFMACIILVLNYSGAQALTNLFTILVLIATVNAVIPYAFCSLVELMLRTRHENPHPLTPIQHITIWIGFLFAIWLIYGAGPQPALWACSCSSSGSPSTSRSTKSAARQKTPRRFEPYTISSGWLPSANSPTDVSWR
ncbi:amino acid permease [Dictyobacter vulcani]|uniref:Amino acid permease n=1 Tax=Dictyobacter vulcani TaxID=2607529 RepID=A0A5J4KQ60_9CHLR|nr:amino acid permease [Dictyobacter vulcani]GER91514.1 amino acid permease [Dictyobacter vulcani]